MLKKIYNSSWFRILDMLFLTSMLCLFVSLEHGFWFVAAMSYIGFVGVVSIFVFLMTLRRVLFKRSPIMELVDSATSHKNRPALEKVIITMFDLALLFVLFSSGHFIMAGLWLCGVIFRLAVKTGGVYQL